MDRFESMTAFVAVAKAGGFSAAARAMGVPLATVSRRVAELESQLGVQFLKRSTRQVVLTETGQVFFATCQRVLDELKDAEERLQGEYRAPQGDLTVTAPMGFGRLHLQPVALEFLAAYPEINIRLMLVDRIVDLLEEHVDLALRIADLPDSGMIARPIGTVRMIVTASPEFLARHGTPTHPSQLMSHDCIAWGTLAPLNTWWFRIDGGDRTFPIRTRFATTNAESAIAAAQAGVGLAQMACYQAQQGLQDARLQIVLEDFECALTPVSLVHAGNRVLPLKLRAFIDFATPRLIERMRVNAITASRSQATQKQTAGSA
jgi:DNA-binding transcriptional LysR family regulator